MKKNGYTGVELLVVIIVLGVVTIGVLASTSHSFKDYSDEYYEEKVHLIEKQAELYGETLNNLKAEGNLVITLDDMIKAEYFATDDSNGNVVDPRNHKATLNGLKVKLTYVEGKVKATVIEED